jgi:hypothetical protein
VYFHSGQCSVDQTRQDSGISAAIPIENATGLGVGIRPSVFSHQTAHIRCEPRISSAMPMVVDGTSHVTGAKTPVSENA